MAQAPNDLTQAIPELSDSESKELAKLLANPLIIKYLRILGMTALFEQASIPYEELYINGSSTKFLLDMAFQKGIMHMADTILTYTPNKEPDNGTSNQSR